MRHDILIVDDETDIRSTVAGILADEGYGVWEAANSEACLKAMERHTPSLVLLDIWLQGSEKDGIEILHILRVCYPHIPVVMMSGHGTIETAVAAIQDGAYDFVEKPFQANRLLIAITRALEIASLRRENASLRADNEFPPNLCGHSPAIREICATIEKVAPTNSRVMITGQPGTGKEVVARQVHALSAYAEGPFVVLNCAALAPEQVMRELFGEESPDRSYMGLLERAHRGTLLLDEVTDMPMEAQGKIVRSLHDQIFRRLGDTHDREARVRILASSSKNLQQAIAAGILREDLYYRLNVVPIHIPPLSERRDDIRLTVRTLAEKIAAALGRSVVLPDAEAMAVLETYYWPGNVREMKNVLERMTILAPHDTITTDMLPIEITAPERDVEERTPSNMLALSLREARTQFERDYLTRQLERFEGNIVAIARAIGMERSALHRKMKALGIGKE